MQPPPIPQPLQPVPVKPQHRPRPQPRLPENHIHQLQLPTHCRRPRHHRREFSLLHRLRHRLQHRQQRLLQKPLQIRQSQPLEFIRHSLRAEHIPSMPQRAIDRSIPLQLLIQIQPPPMLRCEIILHQLPSQNRRRQPPNPPPVRNPLPNLHPPSPPRMHHPQIQRPRQHQK